MPSSATPLPYGIDLTLQGIQSAVSDLRGARMPPIHPHVRAGQALFWLCSFDEQHKAIAGYKDARDSDAGGQIIDGLRFARNAVAHGVVPLAKVTGEEFQIPNATVMVGQWTWRTLQEVTSDWADMNPKLNSKSRLASYDRWIAGKLIEPPLFMAYGWVKQWTKFHYGEDLR